MLAAVAAVIGMFAFNAKADTPINPADLPQAARTFITATFPNDPIVLAERDKDLLRTEYSVELQSGTEIDFDAKGDWEDVSCKHVAGGVPASVIPQKVKEYVAANYPRPVDCGDKPRQTKNRGGTVVGHRPGIRHQRTIPACHR